MESRPPQDPQPDARMEALMRESVQGFTAYVGFTPILLGGGICVARIEVQPYHLQQDGYVHAGVITTLADHAAGYAAYSIAPEGTRVLSVEFKINLLAPGDARQLECRAQVLKPGKRIIVVESEVFGITGENRSRIAKALLTMAAVESAKLAGAKHTPWQPPR